MPIKKIKCSCGHIESIFVDGTPAYQEYILEQKKKQPCQRCQKKILDSINRQSAAYNKKTGFARLEGSADQIAWAETIRKDQYQNLKNLESSLPDFAKSFMQDLQTYGSAMFSPDQIDTLDESSVLDLFTTAYDYVMEKLRTQKSASNLINRQNTDMRQQLFLVFNDLLNESLAVQEYRSVIEAKDPVYDSPVLIEIGNGLIQASFRKSEQFQKIVKEKCMIFDPHLYCWHKGKMPGSRSLLDSAADLASILLKNGFHVEFTDPVLENMVASKNFQPDNPRILTDNQDWIFFHTAAKDTKLKNTLRKLCGYENSHGNNFRLNKAGWKTKWKQVDKIAEDYNFALSSSMHNALESMKSKNGK